MSLNFDQLLNAIKCQDYKSSSFPKLSQWLESFQSVVTDIVQMKTGKLCIVYFHASVFQQFYLLLYGT